MRFPENGSSVRRREQPEHAASHRHEEHMEASMSQASTTGRRADSTGDSAVDYLRVLGEDGLLVGEAPDIEPERLVAMLRLCISAARRQEGDLAATPRQARHVRADVRPGGGRRRQRVRARPRPTGSCRSTASSWRCCTGGSTASTYFLQRQGHPRGPTLPEHGRLFPQQVALAAHLPARRRRGVGDAAARGARPWPCYFGDGLRPRATSTRRATSPGSSRRR